MDKRFECSLCLEHFKDPRILSCFHTFCMQCLQRYLAKSNHFDMHRLKFVCPLCRSENTLPRQGVAGLQKNFYLNEESAKPSHPMCSTHPKEDLRFYCKACKVTMCRDCKVVSHTIHETDMVDNIKNEMKQNLEQALYNADKRINEIWMKVQGDHNKEANSITRVLAEMKRKAEEIKKEIDTLVKIVGHKLEPHYLKSRCNFDYVKSQCGSRKSRISMYDAMLSDAVKNGNSHQVLQMYKNILERDEIRQLRSVPPIPEQGLSEADVTSFKRRLDELFEKLKGNVRGVQGLVPVLTKNIRTAEDNPR